MRPIPDNLGFNLVCEQIEIGEVKYFMIGLLDFPQIAQFSPLLQIIMTHGVKGAYFVSNNYQEPSFQNYRHLFKSSSQRYLLKSISVDTL